MLCDTLPLEQAKSAGSNVANMHAIVAESADRLAWQQVPDVAPGRGEVLIKVSAAGVNRADLLQAAGHYPPPPGASELLGMEVSGVIAAVGSDVGEVGGWVPGQEVCALLAGGGYAEYVAVPAGQLLPIPGGPNGIDLQDAAGLPEVACTVWSNLALTAHLRQGQLILIHGGASGVGTHAIQVARALGARVAVTAGSGPKLDLCRELGAEITIAYHDEDFVARVHEATDGAGADVILDIMGAAYLDRNLDALASDGQLIVIGMQGGIIGELNLGKLVGKRARVIGTALRGRPVTGPSGKSAIVEAVTTSVWPMIAEGRVRPIIGAHIPIQQAAEAHRLLSSGRVTGKIVLTLT
jgi:putative PIG3 family NAD(P)H quinone oxidoreductase